MRISDWSSDVCSSDLTAEHRFDIGPRGVAQRAGDEGAISIARGRAARRCGQRVAQPLMQVGRDPIGPVCLDRAQCVDDLRSEEHTSELQSLMRISYAVFCLKKKNKKYYYNIMAKANT